MRCKPPPKGAKSVTCLGPNPRPHTFRPRVDDGSERICPACRLMQDRQRTPPIMLRAVSTPATWTE